MTKDELWITKWREVIDFMETKHHNPSKRRMEERRPLKLTCKYLNSIKEQRAYEGTYSWSVNTNR